MITREMIENGFKNGNVSIEMNFYGCDGICCRIGDNAFYFIDYNNDILSKEQYWNSYALEKTIDVIFDILKNKDSAEENGIDEDEWLYYKAVLL